MSLYRIRGPPYGLFDEASASRRTAHFLLSFTEIKGEISMTTRPLSAILAELSVTLKALADQHVPPIPLDVEMEMGDRALRRGIDSQIFRVLEMLVLTAHASGLTQEPALQQTSAYREALQVLKMSGKPLPPDL